jgi:hypothetical protein
LFVNFCITGILIMSEFIFTWNLSNENVRITYRIPPECQAPENHTLRTLWSPPTSVTNNNNGHPNSFGDEQRQPRFHADPHRQNKHATKSKLLLFIQTHTGVAAQYIVEWIQCIKPIRTSISDSILRYSYIIDGEHSNFLSHLTPK